MKNDNLVKFIYALMDRMPICKIDCDIDNALDEKNMSMNDSLLAQKAQEMADRLLRSDIPVKQGCGGNCKCKSSKSKKNNDDIEFAKNILKRSDNITNQVYDVSLSEKGACATPEEFNKVVSSEQIKILKDMYKDDTIQQIIRVLENEINALPKEEK